MAREDILMEIRDILRDIFDNEDISVDEGTNANDVEGWDSLAHISIMEVIQREYNVSFSLKEMIEMHDIGDIIDAILNRRSFQNGR